MKERIANNGSLRTFAQNFFVEKTATKTAIVSRADLLAQPRFFPHRFIFEKIIFAQIAIEEGIEYGVAIHLESQKRYCTCPFRPKPCVHAIALNALFDREGDSIFTPVNELPAWANALLEGAPAPNSTSAFAKAAAVKTKQQRRFERLERAANGFDDLEAWLLDTARRGIAAVVSENPKWGEGIAARMADASMTGLSRTLRLLGQIPTAAPDWADKTAAVLADCYLAVRAFQKRDDLSENLLFDLQNFIGINLKKDEVLASGERVNDTWAVVGQLEEPLEDKLFARRTWLLGGKTGRYALLLDFKFGGEDFLPGFAPSSIQQGTLAFYPSAFPQRALVFDDLVSIPKNVEKLPGFTDFDTFARTYSAALATQPWLQIFPAAFSEATPHTHGGRFFVGDKNEKSLPLNVTENDGWRLLALSGGYPIGIFGEWDGAVFKPLSVVAEGRFVAIKSLITKSVNHHLNKSP